MAEQQNDSLLREIDDELRQEQMNQVWGRYGKAFVGAALVLVIGVGGYQYWVKHDRETREALGERFAQGQQLAVGGKPAEAENAFRKLAAEGGGYGLLARFQAAALLAGQGNTDEAVQAYAGIASGSGIDPLYKGLAELLGAALQLNAKDGDPAAVRAKLKPLMADDGPWRYSARELAAVAYMKEGDHKQARSLYDALLKDAATPQRMRSRATEILTILR